MADTEAHRNMLSRSGSRLLSLSAGGVSSASGSSSWLTDGLALKLLLQHVANLVDCLRCLLRTCEHAFDLGLEGWMIERAFDADRDGETGKIVCPAFAFRASDDLRLREKIETARHHVHSAARSDLQQRTRHLDIVGLGDAARDVESAAKRAEGRLGAGALLQIGYLASTHALDQLGQIAAFDRAVADVDALTAGKRMLDFIA